MAKEFVDAHPELFNLTRTTVMLIAGLKAEKLLDDEDVQTIEGQPTDIKKSQTLYGILWRNDPNFIPTLITELNKTRQNGAAAILQVFNSTASSTPAAKESTKDYVVGEGVVTIAEIVTVVDDSDIGHAFLQDLRNLARRLGISAKERKQLLENDDEPLDKFEAVLESWKKTFSSEARLESLLEVIEKCNAKAIADALRKKFGV